MSSTFAFSSSFDTAFSLRRRGRLDEAHQRAGRALGRRVVERHLDGAGVAHDLAGVALVAPERLVVERDHLHHRAHREALGELVAQGGQRRRVLEPAGERRRDRDDHALADRGELVAVHLHAVRELRDLAHRRAGHHALAELLRHPDRDQLRAAHDAVGLRARRGGHEPLERAGRGSRCPRPRCRRGRTGATRRAARHENTDVQATSSRNCPFGGLHVVLLPGLERLAVVLGRVRRLPRLLEVDRRGHLVELHERLLGVGAAGGIGRHGAERAGALVRQRDAVAVVEVVARVVGLEGLEPEVLRELGDVVLGLADELGAALGDLAAADVDVQHPPADPVVGLDHHDLLAGGRELAGGHEPGEARADDHHVHVAGGLCGLFLRRGGAAAGSARRRRRRPRRRSPRGG